MQTTGAGKPGRRASADRFSVHNNGFSRVAKINHRGKDTHTT